MNRKKFIRNISSAFVGSLMSFPFLSEKIYGKRSEDDVYPLLKPDPSAWKDDEINIAWIGHATVLINFFGTIIITDPVLFERVGLYIFGLTFGPSRYTMPALKLEEIPKPDLVLLSHAHMDHMDYETLSSLVDLYPDQIDCVTAFNTKDVIEDLEWKSLNEIDWNEEIFPLDLRIKALEVKHFGWRFPWERDRSRGFMEDGRSFNAYIIEKNNTKILFGGDTAFHELFMPINENNIEVAIMPIGAYHPWRRNHCTPEEALVMASQHIKARHFIPIHFYTFKQGMEPVEEPMQRLLDEASKHEINIAIKDIGGSFKYKS
ncbi:MAG: MBL fold metallo-hydrolase [Ignavibacteriales bacterium]|nr:MAG: MBL fold metallo-hydrolase [Ignavibacteriales bacterium]